MILAFMKYTSKDITSEATNKNAVETLTIPKQYIYQGLQHWST